MSSRKLPRHRRGRAHAPAFQSAGPTDKGTHKTGQAVPQAGTPGARTGVQSSVSKTFLSKLHERLLSTRIAKWFIRNHEQVEHFTLPVRAGLITSLLLFCVDAAQGKAGEKASHAMKFIQGAAEHVHADVLALGAFLLFACFALIGAPLAHWFRRWFVLPLIRLVHHALLVGAGAFIFLIVATLLTPGEPYSTSGVIAYGAFLLLGVGLQAQLGELVAKLPDDALSKHVPVPVIIGASTVLTALMGFVLWRELHH